MFEFAVYEGRRRLKGSLALTVGLGALTVLYVALYPSVSEGIDLDQYAETLPPAFQEAFGVRALGTIEGFLATELYSAIWVLLFGLYLAYAAASVVAGDVERGRMDLLLSLPVSRARVVGEKYLALLVPVAVLNLAIPVVVYVGVALVGESISVPDLLAVHALSVPYLLTCAGVGLAASVVFDRVAIAQRVALGALFGVFLVNALVAGTDFAWLGAVAPMRYYDPAAVLVDSEYDLLGAAILSVAALALVAGSQLWFRRRDIT